MAKETEEIKQEGQNVEDETKVEDSKSQEDAKSEGKTDSDDDGKETKDEDDVEDYKVDKETYALISLLKNPQTSRAVIEALAKDAGLQVAEGKTEKQAVKSITDELREALGTEWSYVTDKIGPIIEKRLAKERETNEQTLAEQRRKQVELESKRAEKEFFTDFPEARKYEQRMIKLMDQFPPSENVSQYDYLQGIFAIAQNSGKGRMSTKLAEKVQERADKNRREPNLRGQPSSEEIVEGSKTMSLKEAVQMAAKKHGFVK